MIVTCNAAGLRILQAGAVGHRWGIGAAEFFAGTNAWIVERIETRSQRNGRRCHMDAELAFGDRPVSVNLTVLPLVERRRQAARHACS